MGFFPKTRLGIWSDILAVAYILFYVLVDLLLGSQSNYSLALAISFTVIGALIAAAAGVTGIISVVKYKEKAVLVYLSTALGFYLLISNIVSLFGVTQS